MPETCWRSWNSQHIKSLLLRPVAVEHLLGVEIFDLGGVPQNFVICSLQQLLAAIVKLRTDGLLDSRIAKLALSRRFLRHQFYDAFSQRFTVAKDTPNAAANDCWDIPSWFRT